MESEEFEYSKKSYALTSAPVRYIWAGYFIFVIISSLLGDSVILIASLRYKAIELHKALVVIINHVAICDLMVTVVLCIPTAASLITGMQVFGDDLCKITCFLNYYIHQTSTLLICAMVICKLMIIKYPLRSRLITTERSHKICVSCWLAPVFLITPALIVDMNDVHFSYLGYICTYGRTSRIWRLISPFTAVVFQVIPTSLVVVMTTLLVVIAKKVALRARTGLRWRGVVTTILTASIYCISILPYTIHYTGKIVLGAKDKKDSVFNTIFYRVAYSCLFLNTISNFYIYSLTMSSFRAFLLARLRQFCSGKNKSCFEFNSTFLADKLFYLVELIVKFTAFCVITADNFFQERKETMQR